MAKKNQTPPPTPPSISPEKAIELLLRQKEKASSLLKNRPLSKDDYKSWETLTEYYLIKAFGSDSPNVRRVTDIGKYGSFPMGAGEPWWENHRSESLSSQISAIDSLIELLQTEIELHGSPAEKSQKEESKGSGVFLVHGHDEAVREGTARFLKNLDLEVTILHEQPNQGRTIIEKFTDYSNVGFAVVLLTPDDRGGKVTEAYETQKPRARQNVILELGYFLGKLGRKRVCALYRQGVEIPSDYQGVLFVPLDDNGAWRLTLARELKAAGLPIDMNKAIQI